MAASKAAAPIVDKAKQRLLHAIRNGDAEKVQLVLEKSNLGPDESADTADNRLLHR